MKYDNKLYKKEGKKINIKQAKEVWEKCKTWDQIREALHKDYGIVGKKNEKPPYWLSVDIMESKLKKPLRKNSKLIHIEEIEIKKEQKKKNKQNHKKLNNQSKAKSNPIFTKDYVEEEILPIVLDLDNNGMTRKEIAHEINKTFGHNIDERRVRHWIYQYKKGQFMPKRQEPNNESISIEKIEIITALHQAGKSVKEIHQLVNA